MELIAGLLIGAMAGLFVGVFLFEVMIGRFLR